MNERLNTRGLAELLANQTGMNKKSAEEFIDALALYIAQGLERNKVVKIFGFGVFKILLVRERESIHIQTGERFVIPAHHKLTFTPDKEFKEQINRPFALFEPIEATESALHAIDVQTGDPFLPYETPETNLQEVDEAYDLSYTFSPDENASYEDESIEQLVLPDEPIEPIIEQPTIKDDPSYFDNYFKSYPDSDDFADNSVELNDTFEPQSMNEVTSNKDESYENGFLENESYEDEYGNIKSDEAESQFIPVGKKKKKILVWFMITLCLVVLCGGGALGTYVFLQHNSGKTAKESTSQHISNPTFANDDDSPLPLVSASTSDDGLSNIPLTAESKQNDVNKNDFNQITSSTIPEENVDRIWQMPSSENARVELKRADKPNQEIEARNRALTGNTRQAQSRNTETSTAGSRNVRPTQTTATNATTPATSSARAIPASVKMPAGSGLMQLSLDYYGDKVFWVYIYEHNKSRIKNFNNIPVGTELSLPAASVYGIDAKNAQSLNRALQKQRELLK